MNYLVTGAAGFIGHAVCQKLLVSNKDAIVVGIDNFLPYYPVIIKSRRIAQLSKNAQFTFYESSFDDRSVIEKIINIYKPKILIHTAAEVGVRNGEEQPLNYIRTNVYGTAELLEAVGDRMQHIILFSSSSVYGNGKSPFKERAICRPISVYGLSKYQMELFARNYYSRKRIPVTIVRPFSVYGPDGRPDMLPMKLIGAAIQKKPITITGKNTKRDWTYIDDLVDAITKIIYKPKRFSTVNIGHGSPISNDEVVKIAKNTLKKHGYILKAMYTEANPAEMTATWADTHRLKAEYHLTLQTDFSQGFAKTAEFYLAHKNFYP